MDAQPYGNPNGPGPAPQSHTYPEIYVENGRCYGTFRKGKYMFPIDEPELERLDVFHKVFLVARRDALHSAPIHTQEPRILDLGCGTGIWSIDMADKYPSGTHLGVDLNYIQPEFIPANLRFVQKDIEVTWQDLEPNSWDLIHLRTLNGSIANWPKVYAEAYRHLKPYHGHIEQVEIDYNPRCDDGTLQPNAYVVQWANELMDAMDGFGRPLRMDSGLTKQRLAEAGFADIKEEVIRLPINGWPPNPHERDIGRWFNLGMRQSYLPLSLAPLSRGHNMTVPQIQQLTDRVAAEVYSLNVHAYCTLHVFTARRPR